MGDVRLTVRTWPGALPASRSDDGLLVISIQTADSNIRADARQQLRAALPQVLGQWLGMAPHALAIHAEAGRAPRVVLAATGKTLDVACSFSHEAGLSLAALHLHGEVGVDLMRVRPLPDWAAVARDYLGPAVAAALQPLPPDQRDRAFAKAWTAREAGLKCLGLALSEWSADDEAPRTAIRRLELALPPGWVGTVAMPA